MYQSLGRLLEPTDVGVQLTIDQDFDAFTDNDEKSFLAALKNLIHLQGSVHVIRRERGSTKLSLSLSREQAEQLLWLHRRGVLDELKIKDARVMADAVAAAIINDKIESRAFDVFLCHNSEDKKAVRDVAVQLRQHGILPWLDEWELRPGMPWQQMLEEQLNSIRSVAVFVGPSGIGPWQQMETYAFIRAFVQRGCPVIPVLLPGCSAQPEMPVFLQGFMWVDFTKKSPDPMDQLIWGITGVSAAQSVKEEDLTNQSTRAADDTGF